MRAFPRLVHANFMGFIRDPMAVFWFLLFPVLFILLFGAVFGGVGGAEVFHIGIAGIGDDRLFQSVRAALEGPDAFEVHVGGAEEELSALDAGNRHVVLVLAPSPHPGEEPIPVTLHYDETRGQVVEILVSTIGQVLAGVERSITGQPPLFEIERRPTGGDDLRNIDYLLPGILAMALMQLGLFGSLRLVGLRERGILRQLGATPLPREMLVAAEVLVRMSLALVQALVIISVGYLVFDVAVLGSWWKVVGIVLLGAGLFVSMGYMLTSFVRTEESGQGIIQLVQFPMMFLSGIFIPVDVMPAFVRPIVSAIPLTYLGDALRQVMAGTPPMYPMGTNLAVLSAWLIGSLLVAVQLFRWE